MDSLGHYSYTTLKAGEITNDFFKQSCVRVCRTTTWCSCQHSQDLLCIIPSIGKAGLHITSDNKREPRMSQHHFPIRNKLNIIKSNVQLFISIVSHTTRQGKQKWKPVSVKFPFDIKTIACQYVIPNRCCHHIKQVCCQICTRWLEESQVGKPVGKKPNACQFMRNNESKIIIGSDIPQFDPRNMVLNIHCCLSSNARRQV